MPESASPPADDRERRRLELDPPSMTRQFELLTDQLPLMVATVDRDLRFSYANRAYTERFDLEPDQVAGRPIAEVIGATALAAIEPYARRVAVDDAVERGTPYDVEYRTLQRDGSYAWIRALVRTQAAGIDRH